MEKQLKEINERLDTAMRELNDKLDVILQKLDEVKTLSVEHEIDFLKYQLDALRPSPLLFEQTQFGIRMEN